MLQNLDSSIEDQIQQLERLQREISESGGDEATISPLQVKFIMSLFTTTVDRCFFFCQRIYFAPSNTIIAFLNRWRWWSKQPARWPTVSPRLPLNTGRRRSWAKHFYYPIYHQIYLQYCQLSFRELHSSVSKVGKAVDRNFVADFDSTAREEVRFDPLSAMFKVPWLRCSVGQTKSGF